MSEFKHIVAGKFFKISGHSNCEADRSVILTELKKLPVSRSQATAAQSEQQAGDLFGDLERNCVPPALIH